MNDLETMQNYMNLLKADAKRIFPGAVSVAIIITAEDVDVRPCYRQTEGPRSPDD